MRVTNGMMVNNMMRNLNKNLVRMDKIQQNLATGKRFVNPSDDPIGVARSLRLNTDVSVMEQFRRNADDAQSWMETTELATDNIISVLQRARELAVQGSSGTYGPEDKKKIADEIQQLREQLVNIGNTTYAGSYIFSGYKTDKPLLKADGTYDLGGTMLDSNESMNINVGIGDKIGINMVGQRIYGFASSLTDLDKEISSGLYEHRLKAQSKYPVSGLAVNASIPNNNLSFSYGGTAFSITLRNGNYENSEALITEIRNRLAEVPALEGHIKTSVDDGVISFIADDTFSIDLTASSASLTAAMGIQTPNAVKALNSLGTSYIDLGTDSFTVRGGAYDNLIKAGNTYPGGGFTADGTIPNNSLSFTYDGNPYTIALNDGAYATVDDMIGEINNQLMLVPALGGHVNVTNEDGMLYVKSDKPINIDMIASSAALTGAMGITSASSVKHAYTLEGSVLDLSSSNISIAAGVNDRFVLNYNGTPAVLTLSPNTYDGTALGLDDFARDMQAQIDLDPSLMGHITVVNDGGKLAFYSDQPLTAGNTTAPVSFDVAGMGMSDQQEAEAVKNNQFVISYMGSDYELALESNTYNGIPGHGLDDLVMDVQNKINANTALEGHITVVNDNGRLVFYSDSPITVKSEGSPEAMDMSAIGIASQRSSVSVGRGVRSGDATQLIGIFDEMVADLRADNVLGISGFLDRIDIHIGNINAVRAELGVKYNRIELTANRIEDDMINLKGLLSKNEDADMSEVIMNLKMEENVYRASLSGGARIIQPSLVDFLR